MDSSLDSASKRKRRIAGFAATVVVAVVAWWAWHNPALEHAAEKVWGCAEISAVQSELQLLNDQRKQHHQRLLTLAKEDLPEAHKTMESFDSCRKTVKKLAPILDKIPVKAILLHLH